MTFTTDSSVCNEKEPRFAAPSRLMSVASKMKHIAFRSLDRLKMRRDLAALSVMSDRELRDIGLIQQDIRDITALSANRSVKEFLASRQYDGTHYVMLDGVPMRRDR